MPTDDERREVARRMRESAGNGEVLRDVFLEEILAGDTGLWFAEDIEIDTLLYHLADLIEPSEPKVRCVAEVKVDGERLEKLVNDAAVEVTGIDRDALLALAKGLDSKADDIIRAAQHARFSKLGPTMGEAKHEACEWRGIARRIREALGVES